MSRDLEKVVVEASVTVREDCEKVWIVYDLIEVDDDVSEQVFTMTFKPPIFEIVKSLKEIETLTAEMKARCREKRDQEARDQETRDQETRDREARDRDRDRNRDRERDPGGALRLLGGISRKISNQQTY